MGFAKCRLPRPRALCYTRRTNTPHWPLSTRKGASMALNSVVLSDGARPTGPQLPRRPQTVEQTGLSLAYIADLLVRALYVVGELTGQGLSDQLSLPLEGVLDQAIAYLRREQMIEIKGTGGIGERAY